MRRLVVDASVAAKWFLADRSDEGDTETATRLLHAFVAGEVRLHQPPHFLAEMSAVLSRIKPADAAQDLADLIALDLTVEADAAVYLCASELAIGLKHHVFDTLYHAVALTNADATLVTADEAYFRKARGEGQVRLLADFAA